MSGDEQAMLLALGNAEWPRDYARRVGMNWKRCAYLCEKWCRKGWYDYGVACDLGWLTPEGRTFADSLTPAPGKETTT